MATFSDVRSALWALYEKARTHPGFEGKSLGPNRQHYIRQGKRDRRVSSNEWEAPDICQKALEVIAGWDADWQEWCKEQSA